MKILVFSLVFSSLLLIPAFQAAAQSGTPGSSEAFDMTGFPQWAKDLRRWNIVSFGTFPFTMFAATFFTDMARWNNANGMDFSAEGRRYAPWPLKSTGGVEMTTEEHRRTILIAVGLSASIAVVDLIIVNRRRNRERQRFESLPRGTYTITITPWQEEHEKSEEADIFPDSEIEFESLIPGTNLE